MERKNVYFPADLIDEIYRISKKEQYLAIERILENYIEGKTEYLNLNEEEARQIIYLADIEMKKAILKYPDNEEDHPNFNQVHEEKYDEIMMGIYEKTYYYISTEFELQ